MVMGARYEVFLDRLILCGSVEAEVKVYWLGTCRG